MQIEMSKFQRKFLSQTRGTFLCNQLVSDFFFHDTNRKITHVQNYEKFPRQLFYDTLIK